MNKSYKGWLNSSAKTIEEYLNKGDEVDNEMIEYFTDILPPITQNSLMLQVGEPSNHIDGKALYMTFTNENSKWIYKGDCFKGKNN